MDHRKEDRRKTDRRVPRRGVNIRHDDEYPKMKRFGYKDLIDLTCQNCGKKFSSFKETMPQELICHPCFVKKPKPNSLTEWIDNI